jgi:hypothetical protein
MLAFLHSLDLVSQTLLFLICSINDSIFFVYAVIVTLNTKIKIINYIHFVSRFENTRSENAHQHRRSSVMGRDG